MSTALDNGDYKAAAKVASIEFKRNKSHYALLMQCHALYQDKRWSDLEALILDNLVELKKSDDSDIIAARTVAIKAMLKWQNIDLARELLIIAREQNSDDYDIALCHASLLGMNAKYSEAKTELEKLNRTYPRQQRILSRLIQVCEQLRDYSSSAGYLRVLLKVVKSDEKLLQKRAQYERLGVW